MRFSINKTELSNALAVVMKGVSTRSTLPILSGILIEAKTDQITLQGTDLELSVEVSAPALVEEEGRTVVPGKLFSEIVRSLPDAAVHIETNENDVKVVCDTSSFSVWTLNPDDFPGFPTVETNQQVILPLNIFTSMVKRVSRVVSRDESRMILTGVLIELEDDQLKMVATDSYRLALAKTKLADTKADEFNAVIAGAFLNDVCGVPMEDTDITLGLSDNQIMITCGKTVFINRRIEGNYPNYRQLLPTEYNTRVTLELAPFTAAVKRAAILSSSSAPMRFDINNTTQTLQIYVKATDVGSVQETTSCEAVGDDVEIAFNSAYVIDGLSAIKGEKVHFDILDGMKPGIFRTVEEDDFLYLIMPVRI